MRDKARDAQEAEKEREQAGAICVGTDIWWCGVWRCEGAVVCCSKCVCVYMYMYICAGCVDVLSMTALTWNGCRSARKNRSSGK